MRLPSGRGAGSISAVILSVSLATLGVTGVHASHHEADEQAPAQAEAAKTIVFDPDDHVMLIDGRRSVWASICNAQGEKCKEAKKGKWTVKPKQGLKLSAKKGAQNVVEGRKPGVYTLTVKQDGVKGTTTVTINKPPGQTKVEPRSDDRLMVWPEEQRLSVGQEFAISAWSCPLSQGLAGPDGIPNAVDDACTWPNELEWRFDDQAVELIATAGPSALFVLKEFPAAQARSETTIPVSFRAPAQDKRTPPSQRLAQSDQIASVIFQVVAGPLGGTTASALAEAVTFSGPLLGDANGDGVRDEKDVEVAFPDGLGQLEWPGPTDTSADPFDFNRDGVVNGVDGALFLGLMATDRKRLSEDGVIIDLPGDLNGDSVVDGTDVQRAIDTRKQSDELQDEDRYVFRQWLSNVIQLARLPADDPDGDGDWDGSDVLATALLTGDDKYRDAMEWYMLTNTTPPYGDDIDEDELSYMESERARIVARLIRLYPEQADRLRWQEETRTPWDERPGDF